MGGLIAGKALGESPASLGGSWDERHGCQSLSVGIGKRTPSKGSPASQSSPCSWETPKLRQSTPLLIKVDCHCGWMLNHHGRGTLGTWAQIPSKKIPFPT